MTRLLSRKSIETKLCIAYMIGQGILLAISAHEGIASSFNFLGHWIDPHFAKELVASLFFFAGGTLWYESRASRIFALFVYFLWFLLALLFSFRVASYTAVWTVFGVFIFMGITLLRKQESPIGNI